MCRLWLDMQGYSKEIAIQILISLLKDNNIKKIIVSPGTTNLTFVASLQHDSFFEIYSCPDERSAAYMACGMATECGEPVVITCTGATASREYLAGLTEAFHRKIPILAVTATQSVVNSDNLVPQYIDRTVVPIDAVKYTTHIQFVRGKTDEWDCTLKLNRAFHYLFKDGGGPVHINLTTSYCNDFTVEELPKYKNIRRYTCDSELPDIDGIYSRIAISCGCKWNWNERITKAIDSFCEHYNAVVIVDHTSGYNGRWAIHPTLIASQENLKNDDLFPELLIHIGEYSGDYYTYYRLMNCKEVWRVNEDGVLRDTFHSLTKVFEMKEEFFFEQMTRRVSNREYKSTYYKRFKQKQIEIYKSIPEIPFSNIYIAQNIIPQIPKGSIVHFGLSNSLRAWTFFDFDKSIKCSANVGCRGIDGVISTAVGASLVKRDKLIFVVLGDLAFFYDMNVMGNRHIGSNMRILLVNNSGGTEFHLYQHLGMQTMGDAVGEYVAADGHYGNKSSDLIKDYAKNLGFKYLSATDKNSFSEVMSVFLDGRIDKPIILEAFTNHRDENEALNLIRNIVGEQNE